MFDTFSCFLNKFHCHIFPFVSYLPNSRSWQLSQRNSWSKPTVFSLPLSSITHWSRITLVFPSHNLHLIPSLCITPLISSNAKITFYKLFMSSAFRPFCNIYLLMYSTLRAMPQSDCREAFPLYRAVTKQLIHSFDRGGHYALGLMLPTFNDGLVSINNGNNGLENSY